MASTVCAGAIIAPSLDLILLRELTPSLITDLQSVFSNISQNADDKAPSSEKIEDKGTDRPLKTVFHAFVSELIKNDVPNFTLKHFTNAQTQAEKIKYVAAIKLSLAEVLGTDCSVYFHKQSIRNEGKTIRVYTAVLYCRKYWFKGSNKTDVPDGGAPRDSTSQAIGEVSIERALSNAPVISSSNVSTFNLRGLRRFVSMLECALIESLFRDLLAFLTDTNQTGTSYINQQVLNHTSIFNPEKTPNTVKSDMQGGEAASVKGSDSLGEYKSKVDDSLEKTETGTTSEKSSVVKTFVVPDGKISPALKSSFNNDVDEDPTKSPIICVTTIDKIPKDAKLNAGFNIEDPKLFKNFSQKDIDFLRKEKNVPVTNYPDMETLVKAIEAILVASGRNHSRPRPIRIVIKS